ncbi:MAG: histidine kinase [Bacteroidia bacterium]|nr:histidine kinase [Bacteroidia bacterium]
MFHNPGGQLDVIFQVHLLIFFYLNYYFFVDKFYFTKKYVLYAIVIVAVIIVSFPVTDAIVFGLNDLPAPIEHEGHHKHHDRPSLLLVFMNKKLYLFLFVFVASLFLRIRQHLKVIQQEKTTSELSFLKAQINPHFLFNTLNSIYSLSLQKSDDAPQAIVKLSSMMRYVLKETKDDYVALDSELNYLRDYVELQKLRIDKKVKFKFDIERNGTEQKIAPLILIPFIENAFKYGVNSEENSSISIKVNVNQKQLFLYIHNNKVKNMFAENLSTNLGIENTRKRLDLLYPGKYELNISDLEKEFIVNLSLQLND